MVIVPVYRRRSGSIRCVTGLLIQLLLHGQILTSDLYLKRGSISTENCPSRHARENLNSIKRDFGSKSRATGRASLDDKATKFVMKVGILLVGVVLLPLSSVSAQRRASLGYQADFLGKGFEVQLPSFSSALRRDVLTASDMPRTNFQRDTYTRYIHFSLATNKKRRQPIVVALYVVCTFCFPTHLVEFELTLGLERVLGRNIDQSLLKKASRGTWRLDKQVGDFQLGNAYYRRNEYDRGHLARRSSAAWGSSAKEAADASDATMIYSNAALQHENFNQDEWLHLVRPGSLSSRRCIVSIRTV